MSFKTTYVLYGLLVAIVVVFAIALSRYEDSDKDASAYVLPVFHDKANPIKQDDIDQVVLERTDPAEKIVFERDPESQRWRITEPRPLRADRFAVNDLVRQVYEARKDEKFDKTTNLESLGLAPPKEVVTLKKGADKEVVLNVGDVTPGERSAVIYVSRGDQPKEPMAVRRSELDSVLKKLKDFRERDLLSSAESDIQAVKLATEGKGAGTGSAVALEKTKDGRWRYTEPPYGEADEEGDGGSPAAADKPPSGVRALVRDLANLKVDYKDDKDNDFVADDVSDFAKYNLDPAKSDVLRIEIRRAESAKGTADGKDEKKTATIALLVGVGKKVEGSDKYYARRADEKSVVKVNASSIEPLRKLLGDPAALRDRTLVSFRNFQTPEAVDIKLGSNVLEFRRPETGKPWQLYRGDTPSVTDDSAVQNLINLLSEKKLIKDWPPLKAKESDLGLDKPSVVISLWAGTDALVKDEKKDEKKDDKEAKKDGKKDEKNEEKKEEKKSAKPKLKEPEKPTIRLSFGSVETDKMGQKVVNVKREAYGETTLAKVPENVLERAREGPLAYLDKKLPHFNEGAAAEKDVVKLSVTRDGHTVEVARDKEGEPWKIVQPKDLAGRKADPGRVNELLNLLNDLRPVRLAAEKASEAELEKDYGLKTPAARVVVTVKRDGKDKAFEFLFGKDLDDKRTEFAKQGGHDLVFTVDKSALAPLFKGDLQDPQVFKFDTAKVKGVKLTGWKNVTGAAFTLELGRKDTSQWEVKAPAGFNLDAGKLGRFLDELANLRAERFLTRDSKLRAAYDAKLKAGTYVFTIELTVEGEKEPLKLTVVNLDVPMDKEDEKLGGDRGYYATSNRLGSDLFQVRKTLFEGPMSRPTHFSP